MLKLFDKYVCNGWFKYQENIIIKPLITELEVFTEKYRTEVFLYRPSLYKRFVQKDKGPIFLSKDREMEVIKRFII